MTTANKPDEKKEIEVPRAAFVECPAIGMKLRRLQACATCEFHKGLVERIAGDKPFHVRFLVGCSFTVARGIFAAEDEQEAAS